MHIPEVRICGVFAVFIEITIRETIGVSQYLMFLTRKNAEFQTESSHASKLFEMVHADLCFVVVKKKVEKYSNDVLTEN